MARSASVRVSIVGDAHDLERATKQADTALDRLNRAGSRVGRSLKTGLTIGGFAVAGALTASAKAAIESEKSQTKLMAQLKASGIAWGKHEAAINKNITALSNLSGLDDEDLQDSFTNIIRSTGDVSKAFKLNALAADIARAKNIDVATAGALVAKVYNGNTGSLSRYGIALKPVTAAQDALKLKTDEATDAQKRAAVAADKTATAQAGIAALQKAFAGQAKAYGDSTAGAQERAQVAIEGLEETIGGKLLPVLGKVANAVTVFVNQMQNGTGAGGKFVNILGKIVAVVKDVVHWLGQHKTVLIALVAALATTTAAVITYNLAVKAAAIASKVATVASKAFAAAVLLVNLAMDANPIVLVTAAIVAVGAALVVAYKKSETFRDIVNGAWNAVKAVVTTVGKAIVAVIHGIGAAFDAVKGVFGSVVQFMRDRLADVLGFFQKILEAASHIPLIGGKFKTAAQGIQEMRNQLYGAKGGMDALRSSADSTVSALDRVNNALNGALSDGTNRGGTSDGGGGTSTREHIGTTDAYVPVGELPIPKGKGTKNNPVTRLDKLDAGTALAALTKSIKDDIRAAKSRIRYFTHRAHGAKNAQQLAEAAQGLASAKSDLADIRSGLVVPTDDPTRQDYLDAGTAKATLTKGTKDDKRAARAQLRHARAAYKKALRSKDPRKIAAAAQALASAKAALGELTAPAETDTGTGTTGTDTSTSAGDTTDPNQPLIDATTANTEALEQQNSLLKANYDQAKEVAAAVQADTALRAKIFASQNGQIMAGIADMVSGAIGGKIGLGVQTPSFASGRVRY